MNLPFPSQRNAMLGALLCAGLAWNGGTAEAAGLGTIQIKSALGEPFRAEIPLVNSSERMAPGCVRLVDPGADEDIPSLRHASVRVVRSEAGTRLLISSQQPVWDPILRVHVRVGCGVEIQREYSVMLDVGDDVKAALKQPERGDSWAKVLPEGKLPRPVADAESAAPTLRKSEPSSTHGNRSRIRKHSGTAILPLRATTALGVRGPAEVKQEGQDDRLVVVGGDGMALRMSGALRTPHPAASANDDNHRQIMRKGLLALADLQKMEVEVTAALDAESAGRPLSASQAKALNGGGDRLVLGGEESAGNGLAMPAAAPALKPALVTPPSVGVSRPVNAEGVSVWLWGGVLAGLMALLGVGWWFIGQRRVLSWPENVIPGGKNKFNEEEWDEDWSDPGGNDFIQTNRSVGATGSSLVKLPVAEEKEIAPAVGSIIAPVSAPDNAVEAASGDTEDPAPQTLLAKESSGVVLTEGGAIPNQLEDLLEVVSVFQAFGRPKAAVDVLEEFLLEKPREGAQPWIRLLALLKELDRREEFCAWAQRYQDAFGGELESWPGEDDAKEEMALSESVFVEDGAEEDSPVVASPSPMAEELPPLEFYLPPAEPEVKESDH